MYVVSGTLEVVGHEGTSTPSQLAVFNAKCRACGEGEASGKGNVAWGRADAGDTPRLLEFCFEFDRADRASDRGLAHGPVLRHPGRDRVHSIAVQDLIRAEDLRRASPSRPAPFFRNPRPDQACL
jgi:hypothetical protein